MIGSAEIEIQRIDTHKKKQVDRGSGPSLRQGTIIRKAAAEKESIGPNTLMPSREWHLRQKNEVDKERFAPTGHPE
jgi:hypothetical protein